MRFDLGTLDSGERSLPFGLLVKFIERVWETDKMRGFARYLINFPKEFYKFNNTKSTNTRLLLSYHGHQKHFHSRFAPKHQYSAISECDVVVEKIQYADYMATLRTLWDDVMDYRL